MARRPSRSTLGFLAVASLAFLALGGWIMSQLKPQFFPKDLQYLSYAEVWLPEDAPLSATRAVTSFATSARNGAPFSSIAAMVC